MPTPLVRSFAGGEVTPEMFGRFDLAKQQTGLALCQNFEIRPHGVAESRAGFEFVSIDGQCQLTDFSVSQGENYALCFEEGEICIKGVPEGGSGESFAWGPPAAQAYIQTDLVLNPGDRVRLTGVGVQVTILDTFIWAPASSPAGIRSFGAVVNGIGVGSILYIDNMFGGPASVVERFNEQYFRVIETAEAGDTVFLEYLDGSTTFLDPGEEPADAGDVSSADLFPINPFNGNYYSIGAILPGGYTLLDPYGNAVDTSGFTAGQLAALGGTVTKDVCVTVPYQLGDLSDLVFNQTDDVLTITHEDHPPAELRRVDETNWEYGEIQFTPTIATPSAPTVATNSPVGPTVTTFYRATAVAEETLEESLPSAVLQVDIGVTQEGGFCDIQMPNPSGAVRVNLYKLFNGLYAFAGQTVPGGIIRDDNIAPDVDKTAPFLVNPFVGDGNFPAVNGNYENRRIFAATRNRPQSYWMTASNTDSNLSYSIPTQDDDAITGTLRGRKKARIRHIAPLSNLVFLSESGEWKFAPVTSDILTPDSAFPKQDSEEGCAPIRPVVVDSAVIFVPFSGTQLRRLEYKWQKSGWNIEDITVLAPHLFQGKTIISLAYQRAPHKTIWAVRSDGVLLGATYYPEHEVLAWHQHVTDGEFESVACVKSGTEYLVNVIVKRVINGATVRYHERKRSRLFPTLEESFCVDSGITYDGPPATTITGLGHLIGEEVAILADGQVHPRRTVDADGHVTLDFEASVVHVGLPYRCRLQTIPPALERVEGFGQHVMKNADKVHVRLHNTVTVKAGPNFNTMRQLSPRDGEDWDEPARPKSKIVEIPIDGDWNVQGQVCVEQDLPLPATVLGLVIEMASEGSS